MIIKLTNMSPAFFKQPILLNTDKVASIYRGFVKRTEEDSFLEEVTFVHCPPYATFEVFETVEEIYDMVNHNNK